MTKLELIDLIKELGFSQTWSENPNLFSMRTDIGDNYLNVNIDDRLGFFKLQETKMWSNMQSGKSFGSFNLKKFGDRTDFQLELFLRFIKGSFNVAPNSINQYIRDEKIKDILQ